MLQLFVEISLLAVGLYAVVTGKLPLTSGINPTHMVESHRARGIGLLLIAPLPLFLCLGILLNIMEVPFQNVAFVEPLIVLVIIIVAFVIFQKSLKPVTAADEQTKENE